MRIRHPCPVKLLGGTSLSFVHLTAFRVCVVFGHSYPSARSDYFFAGISVAEVPALLSGLLQVLVLWSWSFAVVPSP